MEDDLHMRLDCINIRNSAACHGTCLSKLLRSVHFIIPWQNVLQYSMFSPSSLISVRVEPTRREDAWCFAPDSLPRWTNHQPVCGQCRWCPVRRTHRQTHTFLHHFSEWFTTCRAWTMALQDARINTVSVFECINVLFCFKKRNDSWVFLLSKSMVYPSLLVDKNCLFGGNK